jgi:adenine-specific DNA-methyltransferase
MQNQDGLKEILTRYERDKNDKEITGNERQVCESFIFPFFKKVLGWNTEDSKEFRYEYVKSGKRADCLVLVDGIVKFVIEAKSMIVDIDNPHNYYAQAINYARSNEKPFAILTNFEKFIILYADNFDIRKPWNSKIGSVTIEQIKNGDLGLLQFFEKSYFIEKGENNELFSKIFGKKSKPLSKELLEDLKTWRDILRKNLRANERKNNIDFENDKAQIEEEIQRFLDRLIFICFCEDKEMENPELKSHLDDKLHRFDMKAGFLLGKIKEIFHKYRVKYNSDLFENGLCDDFHLDDIAIAQILKGLKDPRDKAPYDFRQIPVEILGKIYENFIGITIHGEKNPKERKDKGKRQKEGIYYTPQYIVNFIVDKTVRKYIKDKNFEDILKIRILDPACGSGSFLIRVFDVLVEQSEQKKGRLLTYEEKEKLVINCIYGVDKDERACDIAKLSLSLKLATRGEKIPELHNNIQNGDSLIDTEKIAGYKAFKWDERFPNIVKFKANGELEDGYGFDIVLGNPPYLREKDNKSVFEPVKQSNYSKYYQGKMDYWFFFLHRSIDVAKTDGYIGIITNSYFTKSSGASKLIARIKGELVMETFIDFDDIRVFEDVSGKHLIHIYKKRIVTNEDKTTYVKLDKKSFNNCIDEKNKILLISKSVITEDNKIDFSKNDNIIFKNCIPLGDIFDVSVGVQESTDKITNKALNSYKGKDVFHVGDGVFVISGNELKHLKLNTNEKNILKKYLDISDVEKYSIKFNNQYLIYSDKKVREKIEKGEYPNIKKHIDRVRSFITSSNAPYGLHRPRESRFFDEPKIICKGMFSEPEFTYDDNKYYVGFSFSVIINKNSEFDLKYLLGLMNSKLGKYWFLKNGKRRGIGVDVGVLVFRKFPVPMVSKDKQKIIVELVDKILYNKANIAKLNDVSSYESKSVIRTIESLYKKIDDEVKDIYGIEIES